MTTKFVAKLNTIMLILALVQWVLQVLAIQGLPRIQSTSISITQRLLKPISEEFHLETADEMTFDEHNDFHRVLLPMSHKDLSTIKVDLTMREDVDDYDSEVLLDEGL